MSSEKAIRKASALEKYKQEQFMKVGGHTSIITSCIFGGSGWVLSYRFLGLRSIGYRAMVALGSYYLGL